MSESQGAIDDPRFEVAVIKVLGDVERGERRKFVASDAQLSSMSAVLVTLAQKTVDAFRLIDELAVEHSGETQSEILHERASAGLAVALDLQDFTKDLADAMELRLEVQMADQRLIARVFDEVFAEADLMTPTAFKYLAVDTTTLKSDDCNTAPDAHLAHRDESTVIPAPAA